MRFFQIIAFCFFTTLANSQVTVDRHHNIDSLYSSDIIDGSSIWEIKEVDSIIVYKQYDEKGEFLNSSQGKILSKRETDKTNDYSVDHEGVIFTMTFWKDNKLVAYTYQDGSFILMSGNIDY